MCWRHFYVVTNDINKSHGCKWDSDNYAKTARALKITREHF